MKHQANINVWHFVLHVMLRVVVPLLVMTAVSYVCVRFIHHPYRLVFTMLCAIAAGVIAIWLTALDKNEKQALTTMLRRR